MGQEFGQAATDTSASRSPRRAGESCPTDRDWTLVRSYAAGDVSAIEVLVERHKGLLVHLYARRGARLRGFADAGDVANEVWYQVLRAVHSGDVPWQRSFSSWVGGICLNVLRAPSFRREALGSARVGPNAGEGIDPEEVKPDEVVAQAEFELAARDCVAALSDQLRAVYQVIYVQNGTNVAAAAALGCTEANVRLKLRPKLERWVARCLEQKGFHARDVDLGSTR